MAPTEVPQRARPRWCYALLLLVILLVAGIRFRLRDMPLERDEGEYAYAGQLMLQGVPPYQLAYNMKLPGTYAAYALIMAVFGQTAAGIHLGLMLVNGVSIVLIFLLAEMLTGSFAGLVAGTTFAVLSILPSVLGFAGHEHDEFFNAMDGYIRMSSFIGSEFRPLTQIEINSQSAHRWNHAPTIYVFRCSFP